MDMLPKAKEITMYYARKNTSDCIRFVIAAQIVDMLLRVSPLQMGTIQCGLYALMGAAGFSGLYVGIHGALNNADRPANKLGCAAIFLGSATAAAGLVTYRVSDHIGHENSKPPMPVIQHDNPAHYRPASITQIPRPA